MDCDCEKNRRWRYLGEFSAPKKGPIGDIFWCDNCGTVKLHYFTGEDKYLKPKWEEGK